MKIIGSFDKNELVNKAIARPITMTCDDGRVFYVKNWHADVVEFDFIRINCDLIVSVEDD